MEVEEWRKMFFATLPLKNYDISTVRYVPSIAYTRVSPMHM